MKKNLLVLTLILSATFLFAQNDLKAEYLKKTQENVVVPPSKGVLAVGDDCTDPIVITVGAFPYDYSDLGQTTCGRGNNISETDMVGYDGGEEIIYTLVLSEESDVTIQMDPKTTTWTGLGLFSSCPAFGNSIAMEKGGSSTDPRIINETLSTGTYYIIIDTYPSPDCIPDFDLTVSAIAPPDCSSTNVFPYDEAFEDAVIPVCWSELRTPSTSSYGWASTSTGWIANGLRFDSYFNSNGNVSLLKSRAFDFSAETDMEMSFWWKNPAGGNFKVLLSSDGGMTFGEVLEDNLIGVSDYQMKTIDLTAYSGAGFDNIVIGFEGTSNYGSGDAYIYLDEMSVYQGTPPPPPPAAPISNWAFMLIGVLAVTVVFFKFKK